MTELTADYKLVMKCFYNTSVVIMCGNLSYATKQFLYTL